MFDVTGYLSNYLQNALVLLSGVKSSIWPCKGFLKEDETPCSLKGKRPHRDSKVGLQLNAVYNEPYDNWLRSFGLKPCWEVPKDCLEIHIWHGYRPNPSTLTYCLKSAFYPSNEVLNMWTHIVPFCLMLWRMYSIFSTLEEPIEELSFPLWIFSIGCLLLFLCSSAAHLFNCYSAKGQELCFCLDYGAIDVYGLASTITFQHMLCPFSCFISESLPMSYTNIVLFCGVIAGLVTCYSRYPTWHFRYICRFAPYAVCYLISAVPCFTRFFETNIPHILRTLNYTISEDVHCHLEENFVENYLLHLSFLLLGVISVATRFPERVFPGTFDVIGHSHQWFHVFMALGMFKQHDMVKNALMEAIKLKNKGKLGALRLNINVWTTFTPFIFFTAVILYISFYTAKLVGPIVEERRRKVND